MKMVLMIVAGFIVVLVLQVLYIPPVNTWFDDDRPRERTLLPPPMPLKEVVVGYEIEKDGEDKITIHFERALYRVDGGEIQIDIGGVEKALCSKYAITLQKGRRFSWENIIPQVLKYVGKGMGVGSQYENRCLKYHSPTETYTFVEIGSTTAPTTQPAQQ